MKRSALLLLFIFSVSFSNAQEVSIDGRLKPLLFSFFEYCDSYGIDYHEKLFKLKRIAIVEDLKTTSEGSILGMVQRDELGEIDTIAINWVAMLDTEILKVVAFHEFGHYFLDYEAHVCDDCDIIMARVNSSYFKIANDWEHQLEILFEDSPAYKEKIDALTATSY
jgi:hypothetical protein